MMMEKLNALFADETFAEEMKNLNTVDELRAVIASKGIELTEAELEELLEDCMKHADEEELTDEQMENTAGGIGPVGIFWGAIAVATLAGWAKDKLSKKSKKSKKNKRK